MSISFGIAPVSDLGPINLGILLSSTSRLFPRSNQVVGGHPSKVIPQLVARAAKHVALELPPKKAPASTRSKPALIVKEKTL